MVEEQSLRPMSGKVEYYYDRAVCLRWSAFGFSAAVLGVTLALVDPTARFVGGIVPGWLFGTAGALLLGTFAFSWLVRGLSKAPALVLDEDGIRADRRLGGLGAPPIQELIPWGEVERVERGKYGSVVVHLRDPTAFWTRQSLLTRIRGFNLARTLSLGGNDLDADPGQVIAAIATKTDSARLPKSPAADDTPGEAAE